MMEINSKNNIRKRISTSDHVSNDHLEDEEIKDVALPGFRFHPTDEELIGFYLRRKVDNKPLTIQLIKQIDIYKYDPWDLPKVSGSVGEKEWYFFCKRGRKYKNSIRPNRVTGYGFWKATGIDKPVHSNLVNYGGSVSDSDHHQEASDHQYRCIGLKKTLVYYRGSAGKGTKTDWMMHEFRLPSTQHHNSSKTSTLQCSKTIINHDPQEAEIWTLCRILERNAAYKKLTPHWKELSAAKRPFLDTTSKKYNNNMVESNNRREAYNIDFSAPMNINQDEKKPAALNRMMINNENIEQYNLHVNQFMSSSSTATQPISVNSFSCSSYDPQDIDFFTYGNWDELRSVVDFALNPNDNLM